MLGPWIIGGVALVASFIAVAISYYAYQTVLRLERNAEAVKIGQDAEDSFANDKDDYARHRRYARQERDTTPVSVPDPKQLLFPPPMVGTQTLKQWMIWTHSNEGVWSKVVDDFYADAASNHIVRPYFNGYDLLDIKRKFLSTLLIVTDIGVTRGAAETLIRRHASLNISGEAYDATILALRRTLVKYRCPNDAIEQMVPMLEALRKGMVHA